MIFFIACIAVCALVAGIPIGMIAYRELSEAFTPVMVAFLCAFLGGIAGAGLALPVAGFTGGADCDYGQGTAVGTVMESTVEGTIWKTCEVKLKQGEGETSQFMELSGFCVPDDFIGEAVRVPYTECFLPDYKRGWSGKYPRLR